MSQTKYAYNTKSWKNFYKSIKKKTVIKYKILKNCLKKIKGSSTGHLPNQVKTKKEAKKIDKVKKYRKLTLLFLRQKKGKK